MKIIILLLETQLFKFKVPQSPCDVNLPSRITFQEGVNEGSSPPQTLVVHGRRKEDVVGGSKVFTHSLK